MNRKKKLMLALSDLCKFVVSKKYLLRNNSEANALLFHFLLKQLGENNINLIRLSYIPRAQTNNKSRIPDIVILDHKSYIFIKVKLISKDMKSRQIRERVWGKKVSENRRVYGIKDIAKRIKTITNKQSIKGELIFVLFDEKGYLDYYRVKEISEEIKKIDENYSVLFFSLRNMRKRFKKLVYAPSLIKSGN